MRYLITLILALGIAALFAPPSSGDLDAWNNGQNANITVSNIVSKGTYSGSGSGTFTTSLTVTNGSSGSDLIINGNSANTWLLNANVGGTSFGGITNNGQWLFPDGTANLPAIGFASDNDGSGLGLYRQGANSMAFSANGSEMFRVSTAGLLVGGNTTLIGSANNTLQFGSSSSSASQQFIKAGDGSGTDKVGGIMTLEGGASTGTGRPGSVIIRRSTVAGSGSGLNAYLDCARYIGKFVDLTDASATSIFTVSLPATNTFGCSFTCTVTASDGTDFQSLTTAVTVDAVAKTTTITAVVAPTAAQTALACSSAATLSVTYTVVDNGSNVLAVKCNADTSFGSPTYLRAKIVMTGININGTAAITEL